LAVVRKRRLLNRIDLRGVTDIQAALPRPEARGPEPVDAVREILAHVRDRGDAAVRELTARFDGVGQADPRVPAEALEQALASTPPDLVDALTVARDAIRDFHLTQVRDPHRYERDGVVIEGRPVPVRRAGVYVPGGRAAYPSTVLMTAVPAQVAGVDDVVLCVPPDRDTGAIAPITLAAAALAGIDEVYAIGGAQAIGALAYGTETIRPVDVIAGPGNIWVAVAKREVAGVVGVAAAFAGPSEIVVVADDTTRPTYAAVDVIVQAEHGPDGMAWLITWSDDAADAIDLAVGALVAEAPRRAEIEATLAGSGWLAIVDGPEQALDVANLIAPEHLQLMSADADALVPRVRNAGAVFCGPFAPASVGDYVAGPSHVLPTHSTARFASALTVDDFVKQVHTISLDRAAFDKVAPFVERLAEAEGFDAHAQSIRVRRESPQGNER
jgi:histidinol dehydrogenase